MSLLRPLPKPTSKEYSKEEDRRFRERLDLYFDTLLGIGISISTGSNTSSSLYSKRDSIAYPPFGDTEIS